MIVIIVWNYVNYHLIYRTVFIGSIGHLAPISPQRNYVTSRPPPYDNSGAASLETFVILIICRTIIHLAPALDPEDRKPGSPCANNIFDRVGAVLVSRSNPRHDLHVGMEHFVHMTMTGPVY